MTIVDGLGFFVGGAGFVLLLLGALAVAPVGKSQDLFDDIGRISTTAFFVFAGVMALVMGHMLATSGL